MPRSFYERHPEALDEAAWRSRVADWLFAGLPVCLNLWSTTDPETEGGRLLKKELRELVDRVAVLREDVA